MRQGLLLIYGDEETAYDTEAFPIPSWTTDDPTSPKCSECKRPHGNQIIRHLHQVHRVSCPASDAERVHQRLHDPSLPLWVAPIRGVKPDIRFAAQILRSDGAVHRPARTIEESFDHRVRGSVALEHEMLPLRSDYVEVVDDHFEEVARGVVAPELGTDPDIGDL